MLSSQKFLWIGVAVAGMFAVGYANYQLVKVAVQSQPECVAHSGLENENDKPFFRPAKKSC